MEDPALEERLAGLLARGDLVGVATAVVRGYGPGILGFLAALLRDPAAARDAFSDFGEALWRALPRFAGKSSVRTWAYGIAYRCALRARRAGARAQARVRPLRDSERSKLAATVESTAASFTFTAARRKLEALRATLTPSEQTLLVLRLDRQMAWEDIALVLRASSAAALRKRFERLKERLRRAAATAGGGQAPQS